MTLTNESKGQHYTKDKSFVPCHPEPGPELASGSNDFGICLLVLDRLLKSRFVGGVLKVDYRVDILAGSYKIGLKGGA